MKSTFETYLTILILILGLFSCSEKNVSVKEGRMEMPEPDKGLRISYEINESINILAKEITNSNDIETCEHGKKIINSGIEILPYLKNEFFDSTETKVYSTHNERNLTKGELAIIIASDIKRIPIAYVVGIQQCVPPFDMDIEHYLSVIKKNPEYFIENYNKWLKEKK